MRFGYVDSKLEILTELELRRMLTKLTAEICVLIGELRRRPFWFTHDGKLAAAKLIKINLS